jgi:hypothetical protein
MKKMQQSDYRCVSSQMQEDSFTRVLRKRIYGFYTKELVSLLSILHGKSFGFGSHHTYFPRHWDILS